MKMIKHIVPVDIGKDQWLVINSLNGLMDKVDLLTFEIIKKWYVLEEVNPEGEAELALYDSLLTRGYLVNNDQEEANKKGKLVAKLRELHYKNKEKCKHITFVMTYNCNFRCHYCFEGESQTKREVLTPEQIDSALKLAGDNLESVGLFGGEPLLPANRKSLEYLISKTKGKIFNITTNGYYLEEFLDLLSQIKISHIMVTLDGDEYAHNKRRFLTNGKPTYKKIMQGIEKCLDCGIPICIRMNIDNSNMEESSRFKLKLLDKFATYKELLTFEISPMIEASYEETTDIMAELFSSDISYDSEERKRRNRFLGRFKSVVNSITMDTQLKPCYSFCSAHNNILLVDPYNNIYTCLVAVGKDGVAVGTYHPEIKFKEDSIYTRNIESIPECKECVYSLLCGGGCPLKLPSYDDVNKPECSSIYNQLHNIMPRLYRLREMACDADKKECCISCTH